MKRVTPSTSSFETDYVVESNRAFGLIKIKKKKTSNKESSLRNYFDHEKKKKVINLKLDMLAGEIIKERRVSNEARCL